MTLPTRLWRLLAIVATLSVTAPASRASEVLARPDGGTLRLARHGPSSGCLPTVIISHGLGGDEHGAAGLAQVLARRGWRVLVMGHAESGRAVLRKALFSGETRNQLIAAATDPARHKARFADLEVAFAEATRACRPKQLVLIGHSMGAATTMIEAGAVARFGSFGRDRFDAYVALSPQGVGIYWTETSWQAVRKPVLMITGTRDHGPDGDYTTRLEAFRRLPAGPAHRLAIFEGINHLQLSGRTAKIGDQLAELIEDFLAGRPSALPDVTVSSR
jgi:dienelactone hydrolase